METILQDIRYGLRVLRNSPGFTAVAVLTLALGIGANTVIFSMVNAVLIRPLPYDRPQQLVKIWGRFSNEGIPQNWISEPEWWDMNDRLHSYSGLAAYSAGDGANLNRASSEPVRIVTSESTASLWPLLHVKALLGRTYKADDDQPGRDQVALLSYDFWAKRFGADRSIVGSSIQLDAENYTVIGVLPQGFSFAGPADMWLPLGLNRAKGQGRGSHYLEVIGRLRPEVTLAQAASELDGFAAELIREYPQNYEWGKGFGMSLVPLHTELVGDRRTALLVLFGAVGFVLLIACANLANLLLARASVRTREIAIRAALGASRVRIVRQLLTESIALSLFGGVAGVGLSVWGVALIAKLPPSVLPNAKDITLGVQVLVFAAAISIFTGILFGLAPSLHLSNSMSSQALKEAGRMSEGAGGPRLRGGLVIAEISMALVLLAGAGLLVRSLQRLVHVDPGFETQHVVSARVTIPEVKYPDGVPLAVFFRSLTNKFQELPGVQAAGAVSLIPLAQRHSSGSTYAEHCHVQGLPISDWAHVPYIEADRRFAAGEYFETMQIQLLRGRYFTGADNENAPLVAIVDEEFAHRMWPDSDAIGQRIAFNSIPNSKPELPQWRTVVGVVRHIHNDSLDQVGREQTYYPQSQVSFVRSMYLVARTNLDPNTLINVMRVQLATLDPTVPMYEAHTMEESLDQTVAKPKFDTVLLAAFGILALVLAGIGIYGVLSYSVSQRTREIGIRVALGATRHDVLTLILSQGLRLGVLGVALGLVFAFILTRWISSLLFEVSSSDPVTFACVAILLCAVAMFACYLPARRATEVDPMEALRYE
jgi:putative ABC transport system permease protein